MSASGSITGSTSNRYITACIDWAVVAQDTANNTSTVEAVLFYRKSSASTAATYGTISGYLNVHDFGVYFSKRVRLEANNRWVEVCRCTRTVTHGSTGSLTIALSASGAISGTTLTATNVSGEAQLPDIPRASSLAYAAPGGQLVIGSPITLCAQAASEEFTHSLTVQYGDYSATILSYVPGNQNFSWTPPLELSAQTPNSCQGTGTFSLYTWNGYAGDFVGRQDVAFTLNVPESVQPTVSAIAVSEATAGLEKQFGAYVQGKSTLLVKTTAAGAYGSTISGCRVTVDERSYSGTKVTTQELTHAGKLTVKAEVTDSRGRVATKTTEISVLPYAPPSISDLTLHRCDAKGHLDETGDYVSIHYAFAVSELGGKNTHTARFAYKRHKAGEDAWAELGSDDAFRADATLVPSTELVVDYRWDVRLTVSDYFGSAESTALLRSSEVIIDLLSSGDGMGIGKTAETRGALELAWQLIADIPLLDQAMENIADLSSRTVTIENAYITTEQVSTLLAAKVDADDLTAYRAEVGDLLADKATVEDLTAATARVDALETGKASVTDLTAAQAQIEKLDADKADVEDLTAAVARVDTLEADKASVADLSAAQAQIKQLDADKASVTDLHAAQAQIEKLDADKLAATDAAIKYANIDFSNIGKAAIERLYATSGIIKDLVIGDTTITGELVGVTIRGDLIEGGTVVADKLVVKGQDGLYYKLNTDGVTTEAQQTDYNSLSGQIIRAKSITASKIAVDDLVAFGATIGGFHITDSALYSGAKSSATNTTRGVYLDSTGQLCVGDSKSYLRYYKGSDGQYRLEIAASAMTLSTGQNVETALAENSRAAQEAYNKAQAAQSAADGLTTRVTKAETSITNNQNEIALRATKSEVTEAVDTGIQTAKSYTDSQLRVTSDSITSTVSKTYATQASLSATNSSVAKAQSTADNVQNQLDKKGLREYIIDLLDTNIYATDTYYPVVGTRIPTIGYHTFEVNNQLGSNTAPSWSAHVYKGFTCNLSVRMISCGWGTVTGNYGWIDNASYAWCDKMPAYIWQMTNSSYPVFYLRGGGYYYVYTDYACTWSIKKDTYTVNNQSVAPTKTPYNWSQLVNNWDVVTRVTNAETSISQNASAISLKASQSSVDALSRDVTAKLDVCITTDPADRSKVISAINASADAIALNSNRLTIRSDNFTLASDGTVTATAGEIGGFKLKTDKVNGLTRRSLIGGYESGGKAYGIRLLPQSGTDEWDASICFVNGSAAVNLEAVRQETGEGFRELLIYGAPLHAANGLRVGDDAVNDFVVAQGTSGIWYYRKWASGRAECIGSAITNTKIFESTSYISVTFPFTFKSIDSATAGTWAPDPMSYYGGTYAFARSVTTTGMQIGMSANPNLDRLRACVCVWGTWK